MKIRHWLVGLGVMAPLALVVGEGCGGDSATAADAGTEAATADVAVQDVAPDKEVVDAAPGCIDADLATLSPADAALNETGASIGTCVACSRANCNNFLTQCNADCDCKTAVVDFYACVAKGGALTQCGIQNLGSLGGNAAQIGQSLGRCVISSCRTQCGVPEGGIPDGAIPGTDAGPG